MGRNQVSLGQDGQDGHNCLLIVLFIHSFELIVKRVQAVQGVQNTRLLRILQELIVKFSYLFFFVCLHIVFYICSSCILFCMADSSSSRFSGGLYVLTRILFFLGSLLFLAIIGATITLVVSLGGIIYAGWYVSSWFKESVLKAFYWLLEVWSCFWRSLKEDFRGG